MTAEDAGGVGGLRSAKAARRVIAIDGPAGSGKSTVARAVADRLGLARLDTGAMYRAVTLLALRAGIDLADEEATAALASGMELRLGEGGGPGGGDDVALGDEDVSVAIRSPAVDAAVSVVAAHPALRRVLVDRQREWVAEHGGGVVEGRDIGSVVFPDARLKIYLTASPDERARRRIEQTVRASGSGGGGGEGAGVGAGEAGSLAVSGGGVGENGAGAGEAGREAVSGGGVGDNDAGAGEAGSPAVLGGGGGNDDEAGAGEAGSRAVSGGGGGDNDDAGAGGGKAIIGGLHRRDHLDSTRASSPLVVADGAVVIDSTGRTIGDVVQEVLSHL